MRPFDTSLLETAVRQRHAQWEKERRDTLAEVLRLLDELGPAGFFALMAALSLALGREVDLIDLNRCHFADRIREKGWKWTPKN